MNVAQSKPGLIKERRKNCREYATVITEHAGRRTAQGGTETGQGGTGNTAKQRERELNKGIGQGKGRTVNYAGRNWE
jgi:hypothetical protein